MFATLKSHKSYKVYGVLPSVVHYIAANQWNIHKDYTDCFKSYFKLYWSGEYLLEQSRAGVIRKQDTDFLVVYTRGCTRGIVLANKSVQFALSFREAQPEFGIPAYVLVSTEKR